MGTPGSPRIFLFRGVVRFGGQFYPLLPDLTPEGVVGRSTVDVTGIGKRLGLPVFAKAPVRSDKDHSNVLATC